jgi:hypothetical protein
MSKVTEFVDVVRELHDTLVERELVYPAEVVGAWASTIFINSNRPAQPPTPMQQAAVGAEKKVTGLLEEKKVEAKQNTKGEAYKIYSFKVDGTWYNTFDAKAFAGVKFTEGDEVELSLKAGKNPKYFNIVAAKKLGEAAAEEDIPW